MSEPNNLLRLVHLDLENFRCFVACDNLEFHPKLTVFVADNGDGKTALLDALRLSLNVLVTTLGRSAQYPGFDRSDIRRVPDTAARMHPQLPTSFTVQGVVDGRTSTWSRSIVKDSLHARTSTKDIKDIRRIASHLSEMVDNPKASPDSPIPLLPIVAYYGTGRLYDEHRLTEGKKFVASTNPTRLSAYLDCLSPSSSFKSFATSYGQMFNQVTDPAYKALGYQQRPENYLTAIRRAVRTVLEPTGWQTIDWQNRVPDDPEIHLGPGFIVVEHPQKGRFPLSYLSDGVRNMIAMVGDLANRCVRLNPSLGEDAALLTPGVVMIDEIDMHLHPQWQQKIIGLLQESFRNVQFIITSHSPQVLSTVSSEHIRIIRHGVIHSSPPGTDGAEAQRILEEVFLVNPRPVTAMSRLLEEYLGLVNARQGQSARALQLREQLDEWSRGHEPKLLEADLQIENMKWEAGE